MAGTDFSHLTNDELIKGIQALNLPDYIRSKAYGIDVRETLAQMTEMTIQLGVNMGLSPDDALKMVKKLQDIDEQLALTAKKEEVNVLIGNLADATPLFASTTTEMTDTSKLYVNTTDGLVYIYKGSSWASTGVQYQSTGIADGTVTPIKLDAVLQEKVNTFTEKPIYSNLYNKSNAIDNRFALFSNGELSASPSTTYVYSGKIKNVIGGRVYLATCSNDIITVLFWKDGVFHSSINSSVGGKTDVMFSVPVGANQVAFNIAAPTSHTTGDFETIINSLQVNEGQESEAPTIFKSAPVLKKENMEGYKNLIKEITTDKNLYNPELAVDNMYYKTGEGAQLFIPNASITGQIPVIPGTSYYRLTMNDDSVSFLPNLKRWDENGVFLGEVTTGIQWLDSNRTVLISVPLDTYYIGLTFGFNRVHDRAEFKRLANRIMLTIVKDSRRDMFSSYKTKKVLADDIYDGRRYKGKKGYTFGDSLTEGTNGGFIYYLEAITGAKITNHAKSGANSNDMLHNQIIGKDYSDIEFCTIQIGTNIYPTGGLGTINDFPYDKTKTIDNLPMTINGTLITTEAEYWALFVGSHYGEVAHAIEYIKQQNKSIQIYIITAAPNSDPTVDSRVNATNKANKEIAKMYGLKVIDAHDNSGIDLKHIRRYTHDGTHFNLLGNKLWGEYIAYELH